MPPKSPRKATSAQRAMNKREATTGITNGIPWILGAMALMSVSWILYVSLFKPQTDTNVDECEVRKKQIDNGKGCFEFIMQFLHDCSQQPMSMTLRENGFHATLNQIFQLYVKTKEKRRSERATDMIEYTSLSQELLNIIKKSHDMTATKLDARAVYVTSLCLRNEGFRYVEPIFPLLNTDISTNEPTIQQLKAYNLFIQQLFFLEKSHLSTRLQPNSMMVFFHIMLKQCQKNLPALLITSTILCAVGLMLHPVIIQSRQPREETNKSSRTKKEDKKNTSRNTLKNTSKHPNPTSPKKDKQQPKPTHTRLESPSIKKSNGSPTSRDMSEDYAPHLIALLDYLNKTPWFSGVKNIIRIAQSIRVANTEHGILIKRLITHSRKKAEQPICFDEVNAKEYHRLLLNLSRALTGYQDKQCQQLLALSYQTELDELHEYLDTHQCCWVHELLTRLFMIEWSTPKASAKPLNALEYNRLLSQLALKLENIDSGIADKLTECYVGLAPDNPGDLLLGIAKTMTISDEEVTRNNKAIQFKNAEMAIEPWKMDVNEWTTKLDTWFKNGDIKVIEYGNSVGLKTRTASRPCSSFHGDIDIFIFIMNPSLLPHFNHLDTTGGVIINGRNACYRKLRDEARPLDLTLVPLDPCYENNPKQFIIDFCHHRLSEGGMMTVFSRAWDIIKSPPQFVSTGHQAMSDLCNPAQSTEVIIDRSCVHEAQIASAFACLLKLTIKLYIDEQPVSQQLLNELTAYYKKHCHTVGRKTQQRLKELLSLTDNEQAHIIVNLATQNNSATAEEPEHNGPAARR